MSVIYFYSFILIITTCFFIVNTSNYAAFHSEKLNHKPNSLTEGQIRKLSLLSNVTHMNDVLDNILIPRVVGTHGHTRVREYIVTLMKNLGWSVEIDKFEDYTPNFGKLTFQNVIARLNPNAKRYLTLACHYDSKYTKDEEFIGATDSAVPCAQLINLAYVMQKQLQPVKQQDVSLMLVFFDGEEAFVQWNDKDSIYGARHLVQKWNREQRDESGISELHRIDILVLLDLIGAPDPKFYNYFTNTEKWYAMLINAENKLANIQHFEGYSYGKPQQQYFQPYSVHSYIEDDHIPFLKKKVPILHLIPHPFPSVWHTSDDNRDNISMLTVENLNKILRVFVSSYLHIIV